MSLTSVLSSDRALAQRLASLYPIGAVPNVTGLPLKAPPRTQRYALIGTAFDYLFRFEVQRRNPGAVVKDWVAEHAVKLAHLDHQSPGESALRWPEGQDRQAVLRSLDESLASAKAAHTHYTMLSTVTAADTATMAEHAIRLAKLDPVYRAQVFDPAPTVVDPLDVQDMVDLLRAVPFDGPMRICSGQEVLLNPTFGRYSTGIGGADADFVAASLLVDIKTTKNPQFKPHLPQIIGYSMLAEAYRREEAPAFPHLDHVGVYFSRQGHLEIIPLRPVRESSDYAGAVQSLMSYCTRESMGLSEVLGGMSVAESQPPVQQAARGSARRVAKHKTAGSGKQARR